MIIGSERKSTHRIDEVILDLSFDGDVEQEIQSDSLVAWVMDEFLPLLETVLDAHDETDTILRIERMAIDLGDVAYTNYTDHTGFPAYSAQLMTQSREQLERVLNNVSWRRQPLRPSVLRRPPFASSSLQSQINQAMAHVAASGQAEEAADADVDADAEVQRLTLLQSDLETLHHFLMSGAMPWYVDTAGTHAHRQLVERILHTADGARMLKSMLLQYPSNDRETAVRRLVYQLPQQALSAILINLLPPQQRDLPGLIHSVRKLLAQMPLAETQREAAMTTLWIEAYKLALDDMPTHGTPPVVIASMLQKAAVAAACDENVFARRLGYSPGLSTVPLREASSEPTTDKTKRPLPATSISIPKTHADYANKLFECFFNALAAVNLAEIDLAGFKSARFAIVEAAGAEKYNESSAIRRQVLALLNASTLHNALIHELSARAPDTALLDLVFLVSPKAAVILEQFIVQIESMTSVDGAQSDTVFAAATDTQKQRFWNNALRYVARLPEQVPANDVLDSHAFARAVLRHVFDDREDDRLLRQGGLIQTVSMQQLKTKEAAENTQQPKNVVTGTATGGNLFAVGMQAWAERQSREADRTDVLQSTTTVDAHTHSASNPYADAVERLRVVFHQTAKQPVDRRLTHQSKPHQTQDVENSAEDRLIFERHLQTHAVSDQWTLQRFLTAMLRDASMPADVIDRWPFRVLQDIVYRLSPGDAIMLDAVVQLAEAARVQAESLYTDTSVEPEQVSASVNRLAFLLYRSALEVLLDADVAKPAESLEQNIEKESASPHPHVFVTAVFRRLARTPEGLALIRLLQVLLPPYQQSVTASHADQVDLADQAGQGGYIVPIVRHSLQTVWPTVERDCDSGDESIATEKALQQEIAAILAALPDDYVTQKRHLQTVFAMYSALVTNNAANIDMARLAELTTTLIRHNPELTVSDGETLIEAIASHAGKAHDATRYYRHVLDALLSDKLLDLDALAATQASAAWAEPLAEGVHTENTATTDYFIRIYRRTVPAIHAVAQAIGTDHTPEQLWAEPLTHTAVRQRLMMLLDAEAVRTALAENIPQSVLFDTVYLLSPPAAIVLEQLLQHVAAITPTGVPDKTDSMQSAAVSDDTQRIWKNALDYLGTAGGDALDVRAFMRAVLSGRAELGLIAAASDRTQPHPYPVPAIQMLLADVQADDLPKGLSADLERLDSLATPEPVTETVFAILAALPNDFEAQRQQLERVLHDKNKRIDSLAREALQTLVHALVTADPQFDSDNRRMFVEAIASHAQHAADSTVFYRRLLEQLVAGRKTDPFEPIDLEALARLSQPEHAALDANAVQPMPDAYPAAPAVAIYQRVLQAIRQMEHDTASQARQPSTPEQASHASPVASSTQIREALRGELQDAVFRQRCISQLPQAVLLDMAFILSSSAALVLEQVLGQAEALHHYSEPAHAASVVTWKQQLWKAALDFLIGQDAPDAESLDALQTPKSFDTLGALSGLVNLFDLSAFVLALVRAVAHSRTVTSVVQGWLRVFTPLPGARVLVHVLNTLLLRQDELARGAGAATATDNTSASVSTATPASGEAQPVYFDYEYRADETFFIDNAGQVLAAPYLPRLFSMLELTEDDAFVDHAAAERAVHLLQFMVKGEQGCAEYQLLLNKLLCGVPTGVPVQSRIVLSRQERDTVDDLIRGMIQNWKTIGNTSVAGLRETFLQRRGQLVLQEDIWFLAIEPGAFDMLLDNLPWGFSVIKHRWMERAIHVTWR